MGIPPAVASRASLTRCYAEMGQFTEGRTLGDEGLQMAEVGAHPEGCDQRSLVGAFLSA